MEKAYKEKYGEGISRKSSPANFGDFDFDTTTGKRKKVVDPMDYITQLAPPKGSETTKKSRPTPSKAKAVSSLSGEGINKVGSEIDAKPVKVSPPKKKLTQADLDKGKSTAKSKGIVSSEGREGSNRQERKKRRQERRSIRKNKDLSASQKRMAIKESRKQQKDNVRGVVKKEAPLSRDGERGDLLSRGAQFVKKGAKKVIDTHPLNPKNITKGRKAINKGIKKAAKKVKNVTEGVANFVKDTQKLSGTGGPSRKNCKYKK